MATRLIEVIVCTVGDAVAAERGGAGRLEIISDFDSSGLTPPVSLVKEIVETVTVPVRVMLRESASYTVSSPSEIERLCSIAYDFARLPVEGLVVGFLHDGDADLDTTARILSCAPNLKATFHRAFEETARPIETIKRLKSCPQIDRILTAGGSGNWEEKIARLEAYERAARPEITILAGGGLDGRVIESILASTTASEFHLGRAVRLPQTSSGAVCERQVKALVQLLEATSG